MFALPVLQGISVELAQVSPQSVLQEAILLQVQVVVFLAHPVIIVPMVSKPHVWVVHTKLQWVKALALSVLLVHHVQ